MDLKERLKRGLQHSRWFTEKVLSEIAEPGDWIRRPAPAASHALWIAGHLAYATNSFVGLVDSAKKDPRTDYAPLFGKGSTPLDDLDKYPTPTEVKGFLSDRYDIFIALLDSLSDDDLSREVPKGPAFMHDVAAVFQMAAWHDALHAGQLTVIHRMLGKTPIADR